MALTDAAEELNRMRTDTNRDRSLLSSTLAEACAGNDINTVRRLLGDGTNTINEGTDDGESLLSLACSAGYYELAQVSVYLRYVVNSEIYCCNTHKKSNRFSYKCMLQQLTPNLMNALSFCFFPTLF